MTTAKGAARDVASKTGSAARRVRHAAEGAVAPGWMRGLARVGFGAKGVVYAIVGALAMQGAAGGGQKGALAEIAQQPFGRVLLAIVAVGLAAYALWRFVSGAVDPHDESDDDAKGAGKRIGYVCSGIVYAALAVSAVSIVTGGAGSGGSGGSGGGARHWTGVLLEMSFGRWLVGLVALGVLLAAGYQLKQAVTAGFREDLRLSEMSAAERTWATRAGRLGYTARTGVYALITWFLASAALADRAERAGGLGKALETVRAQPWGAWLLVVAGLGLLCYGLYCFVVMRYCDASR